MLLCILSSWLYCSMIISVNNEGLSYTLKSYSYYIWVYFKGKYCCIIFYYIFHFTMILEWKRLKSAFSVSLFYLDLKIAWVLSLCVCVYVYVCIYIYIYIHTHTHICVCVLFLTTEMSYRTLFKFYFFNFSF